MLLYISEIITLALCVCVCVNVSILMCLFSCVCIWMRQKKNERVWKRQGEREV